MSWTKHWTRQAKDGDKIVKSEGEGDGRNQLCIANLGRIRQKDGKSKNKSACYISMRNHDRKIFMAVLSLYTIQISRKPLELLLLGPEK